MYSCFPYLYYISFMYNLSMHNAIVIWDHFILLEKYNIFLFFRVQMESILPVEQLMVLSTFLMLLLENWFTRLKVLYGLFLKACDIEHCAVIFSLIRYDM